MKNKDKDLQARLKAENPTLTNEQIEELIAENEASSSDESEGDAGEELEKIAEERAALAEEREAMAEEKALFEKEKAELEAKKATLKAAKSGGAESGEEKKYVCITRCTFDGGYFREGDILITDKPVPEFFTEQS